MKSSCPECDRYIGFQLTCPYCGCESRDTRCLRYLRMSALCMTALSLLFLALFSCSRDIPRVVSSGIDPMMNYARVRVEGVVKRKPYVRRKGQVVDYLSFIIDDGTGELRVAAYADAARHIASEMRLPKEGDHLEVQGSLRIVSGETPAIYLEDGGVSWR